MWAVLSKCKARRERGFTLIEIVVVVAIFGILVALAVPRYSNARKKAYKSEADNVLQMARTLQWAYYQQYNSFDTTATMSNIGLAMPGGSHWNPPACVSCTTTNVSVFMSGLVAPLKSTDSVWMTLSSDGTFGSGSTF